VSRHGYGLTNHLPMSVVLAGRQDLAPRFSIYGVVPRENSLFRNLAITQLLFRQWNFFFKDNKTDTDYKRGVLARKAAVKAQAEQHQRAGEAARKVKILSIWRGSELQTRPRFGPNVRL
jgi:hypothetical protein